MPIQPIRSATWWSLLALFVLVLLCLLVGAWWWPAVVAFAYGVWRGRQAPGWRFWPAFLVGFLVWLLGAVWYGGGAGTLPDALAQLLGLGSAVVLHLIVALLGGLLVGLFAMLGAYGAAVIRPTPSQNSTLY